jgi:hypothetical protein
MSRFHHSLIAFSLAAALFAFAPLAHAASAKKYQVTGTVTALTDDVVTVEKADGEKWELNRDPKAVIKGQLKVGAKVTLMYTMTVASGEVKAGK